jgi:hypothetical protein
MQKMKIRIFSTRSIVSKCFLPLAGLNLSISSIKPEGSKNAIKAPITIAILPNDVANALY